MLGGLWIFQGFLQHQDPPMNTAQVGVTNYRACSEARGKVSGKTYHKVTSCGAARAVVLTSNGQSLKEASRQSLVLSILKE